MQINRTKKFRDEFKKIHEVDNNSINILTIFNKNKP